MLHAVCPNCIVIFLSSTNKSVTVSELMFPVTFKLPVILLSPLIAILVPFITAPSMFAVVVIFAVELISVVILSRLSTKAALALALV